MKRTPKKKAIDDEEAIKNLLMVSLLKEGVDPKLIETATGIPEKTTRNKFPMKDIKKSQTDVAKHLYSEKEKTKTQIAESEPSQPQEVDKK